MKKIMLVMLVAIGLFSLKNVYSGEGKDAIKEFKHAMETENTEALDEFLRL